MTFPEQHDPQCVDAQENKPLSFVDVRRRFGFSSISIGRWVTPEERDRACGLFYRALLDLMGVLQVPEIVISLRETLSLQYGIGGRLGVAAHYEPSFRTFSLAKNAGAGSIAHEWFHALDHYLVDKVFTGASEGAFASNAWLAQSSVVSHPLNDLLFDCLKNIMLDELGENPSELVLKSMDEDKALGCVYYSEPEELCARAFEAFVQDSCGTNSFLVAGTKVSEEARKGLYPLGAQRERINASFKQYFFRLGGAIRKMEQVALEEI